jgi:hypothetical protein
VTTPRLTPAPLGEGGPIEADARAAGIDDAYDDHHAGTTLPELQHRLDRMTQALPDLDDTYTSYVLGYAAAVISLRLHHEATTTAQTTAALEEASR